MKTKIDIKSALVGLSAGLLVTLVVAASTSSGNSVGRYQITSAGQGGNGSECFIIDTMNGKVWTAAVSPNCDTTPGFFQPKNDDK